MKRWLWCLWSVGVMLSMTSCNLFIEEGDDLPDEVRFKDVPEYNGNGYDAPMKVSGSGCEATYQLKRNVRRLDESDLKYINYVQRDEIGALIEIHYSENTPADLLPVPGEILLSGVNDKFDWGCSHKLQNRTHEDGVYKYLGTLCTIKEVYEVLEIDGELTNVEDEEYYVMAEPEKDENGEVSQSRTRASDNNSDGMGVQFLSDGFSFSVPFDISASPEWGHFSGEIKMEKAKNFTKVTVQAKFDDFSLTNPVFKLVKTEEDQNTISFTGSFNFNKHKTWRPVKGKAFTIGPLVIVFFVNVDLDFTFSFNCTSEFSRHKKVVYTYTVDLYNGTCTKSTKKVIDQPWSFGGIDTTFSFEAELGLMIGFGFYGKVFSVRFGPYLSFLVETESPPKKEDGVNDASSQPGVNVSLSIGGKIQFMVDLTFDGLFGSAKNLSDVQHRLDLAKETLDKNSDAYKSMMADEDVQDFVGGDDNETGITIKLGPWPIWNTKLPWYPVIDDNSFIASKYWVDDNTTGVHVEYKVVNTGWGGSIGSSNGEFVPAIRVLRLGKEVERVFPEEGGTSAKVEKGKTYHFTLPQLNVNWQYKAQICYYDPHDLSKPAAADKSLPVVFYTPSVSIESVTPVSVEENPEGWNKYEYYFVYLFKLDSRIAVEGAKAFLSWGVRDMISDTYNSKSRNDNYKDKDGTYVFHWWFVQRTNVPASIQKKVQHIDMVPVYRVEADQEKRGTHYELKLYSNRTYDIIDDGTGFSAEGLSFGSSNARGSTQHNASVLETDNDAETEIILGSIEDPDGNIIYEYQGDHHELTREALPLRLF